MIVSGPSLLSHAYIVMYVTANLHQTKVVQWTITSKHGAIRMNNIASKACMTTQLR